MYYMVLHFTKLILTEALENTKIALLEVVCIMQKTHLEPYEISMIFCKYNERLKVKVTAKVMRATTH